jgi:hypothetical protein
VSTLYGREGGGRRTAAASCASSTLLTAAVLWAQVNPLAETWEEQYAFEAHASAQYVKNYMQPPGVEWGPRSGGSAPKDPAPETLLLS